MELTALNLYLLENIWSRMDYL